MTGPLTDKKLIAYGAGPALAIYLANLANRFAYAVDGNPALQGTSIHGVEIFPPSRLAEENPAAIMVIITALSSPSLREIHHYLSDHGFVFGENYLDLSTLMKDSFKVRGEELLHLSFSWENYLFARAFNFNSATPIETGILGNWLLMELIQQTRNIRGAIAEVGAYQGGNTQLLLSALNLWQDGRRYYVLDSFQGFGSLSPHDPQELKNAYNYDFKAKRILNTLRLFPNAQVIPGFVPESFARIPAEERFSLVFYDCDLYQPALDTFAFFWGRLEKGGFLVIHDYVTYASGWVGVKKATDEFFNPLGIKPITFFETTMTVIVKETS